MEWLYTQAEIVAACHHGHMGMELSFVPIIATIGQIGVVQAYSTDYGSENVARFVCIGRDGNVNVWRLEEIIQPFFVRLLRRTAPPRTETEIEQWDAWYNAVQGNRRNPNL